MSESQIERAYARLVKKLILQLNRLEEIGENDMGVLHRRLASRYHTITRNLHKLVNELSQDVYYPDEPIG